jgi:1-acyl-sn-glycerol-3-phosphate acyltransferase
MIRFRLTIFNVVLYGTTAVMCCIMLWALLLPRRHMMAIVHLWLNIVAWLEKNIGGITYRVIGRDYLPPGPCIIAAKHQSAWETFKLHLLFDDPAVVLKQELLDIPLWGWYLRRSGMIPINRAGRAKALSGMLTTAQAAVDAGRKIIIFPQGTRTAPGEWKPYKSGIVALYQGLNLSIVPMAHNSGLIWPKKGLVKKSGCITIEFLPPIPPGLTRDVMMAQLQDELESTANRLIKNGV